MQLRLSYSPKTSGDQPIRARTSAAWVTGSKPATRTSPASGLSSVASTSISVVLPAPFGPTSAVTWPGGASRSMPWTACTGPKERRTPRACTPAVGATIGGGPGGCGPPSVSGPVIGSPLGPGDCA